MFRSINTAWTRAVAIASSVGVLAVLLVAVPTAQSTSPASAADASLFNPGYIISDAEFYNGAAMSEAQIQAFLEARQPGTCGGAGCLKNFRMTTGNKAQYHSDSSGQVECTAYTGAANESAARIIFRIQQACGISAKVILVTLQKERSLVTKTTTTQADWNVAMGYACPDTAPCAVEYYGFFNQVWAAARQFKVYRAAPTYFNFRAGITRNIQWHPNTACGSSPVYIANAATAGLYNYTPYQPNAAALGNLYGSGDGCSSYGNRNFWAFYSDWFGSPIGQVNPIGSLESATSPAAGAVTVRGWTFDYDTQASLSVHVYVDGAFALNVPADRPRADVNAAYPSRTGNYGFEASVPAASGSRQVCVYAINVSFGGNSTLGCKTVTVARPAPVQPPATESAAVYRFWSESYQTHFYTRSVAERDQLILQPNSPWQYEGPRFGAFGTAVPGTIPVYRFWSEEYRSHFFTASETERATVENDYPDRIWKYETIAYYVYPVSSTQPSTVPMSRFWSPAYLNHFYTASAAEAEGVRTGYPASVWTFEGDVFRVPAGVPAAMPLP